MSKLQKNLFEWMVFAVGLVLVTATLAYLVYEGATMGSSPPSLEVRLGTPEPRPHSFIVPVTVINHGDKTAGSIRIEVLMESGDKRERGEVDIPFLPRGATREGWVTFEQDPRTAQLKARVLGYEEP
ncbi:MAG TPA: hypothetical protein VF658_04070 [Pyrinomonadaceae bacterium]